MVDIQPRNWRRMKQLTVFAVRFFLQSFSFAQTNLIAAFKNCGGAAFLFSLLLATGYAGAQTSAPTNPPAPQKIPRVQERIEVTATRIPEDPEKVPAAIEVFTGDELTDWGARDLRSALALAVGVEIAPGGDTGPASSVPEFWGLKEFDAFLLVVDEVPWGGAFNPALSTLSLEDLDHVEVLRGPAPVMYGATSFVGVLHVVHRPAGDPAR